MKTIKVLLLEYVWPIFCLLVAMGIFGVALYFSSAQATASPFDPHVPDITRNHCPGGGPAGFYFFYCDGEHYPDGSYWHQVKAMNAVTSISFGCVVDNGDIVPPPAPVGACGGEWQG